MLIVVQESQELGDPFDVIQIQSPMDLIDTTKDEQLDEANQKSPVTLETVDEMNPQNQDSQSYTVSISSIYIYT